VTAAVCRVRFREEELHKKMEQKEKKKEELQQAEVEKERVLEAIRQKVTSLCHVRCLVERHTVAYVIFGFWCWRVDMILESDVTSVRRS